MTSWLSALIRFVLCLLVTSAYTGNQAAASNPVVPTGRINPDFTHGSYPSPGVGDGNWTHVGVDIVAACGDDVYAFADGVVVNVINNKTDRRYHKGLGFAVVIKHAAELNTWNHREFYTLYLHLRDAPLKNINDHVVGGQTIMGKLGRTPDYDACHLHFEVRYFEGVDGFWHPQWGTPTPIGPALNIYGWGDQSKSDLLKTAWKDPQELFGDFPDGITATKIGKIVSAQDCKNSFVTILPGKKRCGFLLKSNGALVYQGTTVTKALVVSYSSDGSKSIAARLILFPPSPSGRYRIVQACDAEVGGLCWAVFVFDAKREALTKTYAGKYGPEQWIRWSKDEAYAVLINDNEGANWLHFIRMRDFRSLTYPEDTAKFSVIIDHRTFEWLNTMTAKVRLTRCELHCYATPAKNGHWETLTIRDDAVLAATDRSSSSTRTDTGEKAKDERYKIFGAKPNVFFPKLQGIIANPYAYEGKDIVLYAIFIKMMSRNEAIFEILNDSPFNPNSWITDLPSALFTQAGQRTLIQGTVLGQKSGLLKLRYKGSVMCKLRECEEMLKKMQ